MVAYQTLIQLSFQCKTLVAHNPLEKASIERSDRPGESSNTVVVSSKTVVSVEKRAHTS